MKRNNKLVSMLCIAILFVAVVSLKAEETVLDQDPVISDLEVVETSQEHNPEILEKNDNLTEDRNTSVEAIIEEKTESNDLVEQKDETEVEFEILPAEEPEIVRDPYYYLENKADRFTLVQEDLTQVFNLVVDKYDQPSYLPSTVNVHLKFEDDFVIYPMILIEQKDEFLRYEYRLSMEDPSLFFEASFSINLNGDLSRKERGAIVAFSDDKWTRISGEANYVTYDDFKATYKDGVVHAETTARFKQTSRIQFVRAGIFRGDYGTTNMHWYELPITSGSVRKLVIDYNVESGYSNQFLGVRFMVTYSQTGGLPFKEVLSDISFVYIGSTMSINKNRSKMMADSVHIEGQIDTVVEIPTLQEDLIVHIKPKGTSQWLLLSPENFTAVYTYGRHYTVTLDADLNGILTPVLGSFYDVQFTLSTSINDIKHGFGSATTYAQETLQYKGSAIKKLYTFADGVIATQTQDYTVGVKPIIDPYYTETLGSDIEQYQYLGWSRNQPQSEADVQLQAPPAFEHVEQVIYLIYKPVVAVVQFPEVFKFESASGKSVTMISPLDLSAYSQDDLKQGLQSVIAISNTGPKDQKFDIYVSLSPFDNGKGETFDDFTMAMHPDLVKVVNHGNANQSLNVNVGSYKPIVNALQLKSNNQSQKLLANTRQTQTSKLAIWGLKFTKENTQLTRPLGIQPAKFKANLHWDLKTGLNVTE